jgi:hypothetical protein
LDELLITAKYKIAVEGLCGQRSWIGWDGMPLITDRSQPEPVRESAARAGIDIYQST